MDSMTNPITVIYEDNHLLGIIKPANIPVQADKSGDYDVLSYCKLYLKEKYDKPGNVYCGLVHRLDRPVGGVMIFGKTSKATSRLAEIIRNKQMKKIYRALVSGDISIEYNHLLDKEKKASGEWISESLWLLKDEVELCAKIVHQNAPGAKLSQLLWRFLNKRNDVSEIEIELITGRYHQIRVTFAEMGYPLVGDGKYGTYTKTINLKLFATYLSFEHPVTHEIIELKANPTWA
jgi:23S rRNA pseudouridine1911/1915/1917 synthase